MYLRTNRTHKMCAKIVDSNYSKRLFSTKKSFQTYFFFSSMIWIMNEMS